MLKLIPDDLLMDLAAETKVDYQVKKLYGQNVFNLLLYGLMRSERVGLRSLEDFYNSKKFKALFRRPGTAKSAKYNSLSVRLGTMNVRFFEKAYEAIYQECRQLYDENTLSHHYQITRVDSTMVAQTATKLEHGINVGRKKDGKKQIKYTISLTDLLPSSVEVFTEQKYISENLTIPTVILKNIDRKKDNVFVFDRGVFSREVFCSLDQNDYLFVTRLNTNAKHAVLENLPIPEKLKVRNLTVLKDQRVVLFRSGSYLVDHPFRLIQTENETGKPYWFLTNQFDLPAETILMIYRQRWDIEVFFRFLKQELNFKHLISTNENGIQVLLYMTLILAMLILIYKRVNGFGYRTSKRRFAMELEEIIDDYMILRAGGDPNAGFP